MALAAVGFQRVPQFRIESGDDGGGEGGGVGGEGGRGHAPEVAQEGAFEAVELEDGVEGQGGEKHRQQQRAPRFAADDVVAEQQLGVPGEQRAIEVKQGDARRRRGRDLGIHSQQEGSFSAAGADGGGPP